MAGVVVVNVTGSFEVARAVSGTCEPNVATEVGENVTICDA